MHKLKEMILMLCLILSGALCYASGAAGMENRKREGIPNVNQFVVHENGPLHNSPIYNSPYFECSFKGAHLYNPQENDPQKRSVRIHALTVTYAGYQWYNQHQME